MYLFAMLDKNIGIQMRFYVFNSPIKWQFIFKFRRPLTIVFILNSSLWFILNVCKLCYNSNLQNILLLVKSL